MPTKFYFSDAPSRPNAMDSSLHQRDHATLAIPYLPALLSPTRHPHHDSTIRPAITVQIRSAAEEQGTSHHHSSISP
jgi:hypothetical protein